LLKKLKQFTQKDFDNHNGDLQDILAEYDLTDIMNYDVIWNDFKDDWCNEYVSTYEEAEAACLIKLIEICSELK
jgi:hypothetical protein